MKWASNTGRSSSRSRRAGIRMAPTLSW
jgi:hypothetical protein